MGKTYKKSNYNEPNPQSCPFCNKMCKSDNSYKQHICRCKNNPNRIESVNIDFKERYRNLPEETKKRMAWAKGLTADTNESIRIQVQHRPKTHIVDHVYEEYNQSQISKWLDYISNIDVNIDLDINYYLSGYPTISKMWERSNNTVAIKFVHDYVANILLSGNLCQENTVHHINKDINDFDKYNLMVFRTNGDHKRFHNSKYAKLIYDENTHLFDCVLDKNSYKSTLL